MPTLNNYKIDIGSVTKYSVQNREKIKVFYSYHFFYVSTILFAFFITYRIFTLCLSSNSHLEDTISLGSIFATFGSALVSVFSLSMASFYERFKTNLQILFTELTPDFKWYRWPFIKRASHSILYNGELTYQKLTNATITFCVGSHDIILALPTIKEDFYDLPNWHSLFTMLINAKDYESYLIKNTNDPIILSNSLMTWDCVLDNFKTIAQYKISKLLVIFGSSLIFASVFLTFFYYYIPF